jgi:hypothetical protein
MPSMCHARRRTAVMSHSSECTCSLCLTVQVTIPFRAHCKSVALGLEPEASGPSVASADSLLESVNCRSVRMGAGMIHFAEPKSYLQIWHTSQSSDPAHVPAPTACVFVSL